MSPKAFAATLALAVTASSGAFAGTIPFTTTSTAGFSVVDRNGAPLSFVTNDGYLVPSLTVLQQQMNPFQNPTGYWEARTTLMLPATPISNVRLTLDSFAIDDRAGVFFNDQRIAAAGLFAPASGSLQRRDGGGGLSTIDGVTYLANRDVFNPGPGGVGVNVPGDPLTFMLTNFLPGANELLFVINNTGAGFSGSTLPDGAAGPTAMIAIGSLSWDDPVPPGQVPVPATLALLGAGLLGVGRLRARHRRG